MGKPHQFFCRECRSEMRVLFFKENEFKKPQPEFLLRCNPKYGTKEEKYFFWLDFKNNELFCHNCQVKLIKIDAPSYFILRDFKCPNCNIKFAMKINDYMPGNAPVSTSTDSSFDNFDSGKGWSESDKKRIQEEEGFSDEDMANGAWIDY
jgi:hypothetical protein